MTTTQTKSRIVIERGALTAEQASHLSAHARQEMGEDDRRTTAFYEDFCVRPCGPVPRSYGPWILASLNRVAKHFRSPPVTAAECAVARYRPGEGFGAHTDYDHSLRFRDRTVSFIVLLTHPGFAHTGGELLVEGKVVDLVPGDLVGFTSITPHEVRPVRSGLRMAMVGFGHRPGAQRPQRLDASQWFGA